ncbi:uncharacterized protein LOC129600112 [Paramacrobiotus metropolitanus]|uniref:uncharacterized protein LOC129600112 n=1 Tax=Paramacrobiotus metropolitanus TaxID=2943436 RepID=UPI002445FB2C|nr:uncharacterized protein LOC129600112 [Paramacrobiotus metropolitanus]
MILIGFALLSTATLICAWLPDGKIRGVNLGSLFVIEPWMAHTEWTRMGCADQKSEFDCVMRLGQAKANQEFQAHWDRWITQADIQKMKSYGLNTIRIPVGYWIYEDIVYKDSEHFPQGGLAYLERLCGWASDAGLYIIMDLHGAPGAQEPQQPFTGQYAPTAGFFVSWQYDRAYKFLAWMTRLAHTNHKFRNVGTIEIVNEPARGQNSLVHEFYPKAFEVIRNVENSLNIAADKRVHIMTMDKRWGAGDPKAGLTDLWHAAYDNHRYIKYDTSVPPTRQAYLRASCNDDLSGNWPVVVGEWSISPKISDEWGSEFNPSSPGAAEFYKKWWAAQVMAYEKQNGWVFWSWKTDLNDYRWSYSLAVEKGIIPKDPTEAYRIAAC